MRVLTRYLLLRQLATVGVVLGLLVGLIWLSQALRLAHHVLGAAVEPALLGQILLVSLPTLVLHALPLALAAGILLALGRLAAAGELLAMRIAGASPLRLAVPSLALAAGAAVAAVVLGGWVEEPALRVLRSTLRQAAASALVLDAAPGRFRRIGPETTLYVERIEPAGAAAAELHGFMLATAGATPALLLAESARAELAGDDEVRLALRHGELQTLNARGGLRRVRFETLERRIALAPAIGPHLGFLDRLGRRPRATAAAALSCLGLGLIAAALGLVPRLREDDRSLPGAWRALVRSEEGARRERVADERPPQRPSGPARTAQDPCGEVLEHRTVWKSSRDAGLRAEPGARGASSGAILEVLRTARVRLAQTVSLRRSRLSKPSGALGAAARGHGAVVALLAVGGYALLSWGAGLLWPGGIIPWGQLALTLAAVAASVVRLARS